MTRGKRRILFGTGALTLVLIGLGVWFYHFYFVSTGAITQHAENFLFRRMTVAQLAEQGSYRFFFITNRRNGTKDGPLEERFGNEREEALKFGSFDARIEPSLGLGMIINPSEWFQNEEIQLRGRQAAGPAPLSSEFEARSGLPAPIAAGRRARLSGGFPSALRKTAFLGHVLDINSPVLLFDWPGNQGSRCGATGARTGRQSFRGGARRNPAADHSGDPARQAVADREQHGRAGGRRCLQPALSAAGPGRCRDRDRRRGADGAGRRSRDFDQQFKREITPCPEPHGLRLLQRPGLVDEPHHQSRTAPRESTLAPDQLQRPPEWWI